MMFGEVIEQLKEQRVTEKEQRVTEKEQRVTEKEQRVTDNRELIKALKESNDLFEQFLKDFKKAEGVIN
ncbi:hypothetical protein EOM39_05145 [Candidatus Gracilibacteria bacterium]|nr:hypothetical protein [Candidatus Gracilibacteria bacterium]